LLGGGDRADGVGDRALRLDPLGGDAEEVALKLRERLRAPAQIRPRGEDAEPRARSVDQNAVEAGQLGRQLSCVGVYHGDVLEAQPLDVLLELARPTLVELHRHDLCRLLGQLGRLSARRSTEVEHSLALLDANRLSGELRSAALRPDATLRQLFGVDALDDAGLAGSDYAHGSLRRLVLRLHESERLLRPPLQPPGLGD